jgi:U-box domain
VYLNRCDAVSDAQVCIERWLQQGNRTCPVTGMRLRHLELTPNFALRVAVQVGGSSPCAA